jgi:MYND finger
MKTIALVKKNKCNFDRMEEFVVPLLYKEHTVEERTELKKSINDYIWSVIEPYITFIDVDMEVPDANENFMTVVCTNLVEGFPDKRPDDFFYHTEGSYSFPKKFIEFIHCQPAWKDYKSAQIENMNNLCCLFSLKHNVIENNCVIFANRYDLDYKYFTAIDTITKEDIIKVVRRRYFFSGVVVKENSLTKYYYQNPSYLVSAIFNKCETDTIEKIPYSHLNYKLVFYFQQDTKSFVNKICTRMNGLFRIYGPVLIIHELEENIYANISLHEVKRLNVLSYGRLYDRQPKVDENHIIEPVPLDPSNNDDNEVQKKLIPMWSRYICVNKRMIQWQKTKNLCINCSKEMTKPIICERCYRAKYCSESCQKSFDNYHYEECINPSYA